MKAVFTIIAILYVGIAYSQDVIKIKDTDPFNCKIIVENSDYVQFIRRGDTTLTIKKVPRFLVEYVKINNSIDEATKTDLSDTAKVVVSMKQLNEYVASPNNLPATHDDYDRIMFGFNAAIFFGVGSTLCGVINLLSTEPTAPSLPDFTSANQINEYNRKMADYQKELSRHRDRVKVTTGLGIGLAGIAIMVGANSGYQLAKLNRNRGQQISLAPTGNGFVLAYRF